MGDAVDVHQHLWSDTLVDRLRARSQPPYLRGWTLHLDGERPFEVDPTAHDVAARVAADEADGVGSAVVGISSPLGVEDLRSTSAGPLLAAYHADVEALPGHFRAWASVAADPDLDQLRHRLGTSRYVGLQVPATHLTTPAAWERAGALLDVVAAQGSVLFVHPGPEPARPGARDLPAWWAPTVGYTAQLQAAWWAWHAAGVRGDHPRLRVLFAAGAGLAPLLRERQALRDPEGLLARGVVDPHVYLDTSGHGPRALESLVRVVGIDALALGSDRPYAAPLDHLLDPAATHAVRVTNPHRLLDGAGRHLEGARP
ncbi:amidohydrolase family protein [Nocardioides zeae]|uniref:Amidohydrolase family protein n=1 Tax=Nocardioides imazamoxiresistens TaxID=3231893 RepID=A0ABU3PTE9_9ACTN|nr:amidohydrolase family protein [Nocardioides zeae]MDT9592080.1 amidohydrolase family protein [Nocardioides zeae]